MLVDSGVVSSDYWGVTGTSAPKSLIVADLPSVVRNSVRDGKGLGAHAFRHIHKTKIIGIVLR